MSLFYSSEEKILELHIPDEADEDSEGVEGHGQYEEQRHVSLPVHIPHPLTWCLSLLELQSKARYRNIRKSGRLLTSFIQLGLGPKPKNWTKAKR